MGFTIQDLPLLDGWIYEAKTVIPANITVPAGEFFEIARVEDKIGWHLWSEGRINLPTGIIRILYETETTMVEGQIVPALLFAAGLTRPDSGLGIWCPEYDVVNSRFTVVSQPVIPQGFNKTFHIRVYAPANLPLTIESYSYVIIKVTEPRLFRKSLLMLYPSGVKGVLSE